MAKVSIIIPTRNEIGKTKEGVNVLLRTVQDIYEKATGEIEVLVGFDGLPTQRFPTYPDLTVIEYPKPIGIKAMINELAMTATGKYIYKSDSHCMFGKGFDEILQEGMHDNWVVTPRFKILDAYNWKLQERNGEVEFYDYFYLCCPFTDPRGLRFKAGGHWKERTNERLDIPIDETPQMHGSGWFVNREHFLYNIGGFPEIDPEGHAQEPPYLGLKSWLSPWGGKLMVNKNTWYAHWHQNHYDRGYHMSGQQDKRSYDITFKYWLYDKWEERSRDFEWFVDTKFPNMPTWPPDWKELFTKYRKEHPENEE